MQHNLSYNLKSFLITQISEFNIQIKRVGIRPQSKQMSFLPATKQVDFSKVNLLSRQQGFPTKMTHLV